MDLRLCPRKSLGRRLGTCGLLGKRRGCRLLGLSGGQMRIYLENKTVSVIHNTKVYGEMSSTHTVDDKDSMFCVFRSGDIWLN
jgi:hypothetical protein